MEIIKFLLSFFFNEYLGDDLNKIYKLFEENSFDVKKVLANVKPDMLAPLIKSIMSNGNKKSPNEADFDTALKPISPFANGDIIKRMKILMQ